jgi:hypothetical protein
MSRWPDGTPKSTGNAFDWNTGEPTVFATDSAFTPRGQASTSHSQIASLSREKAEASGKDVATVGGMGRLVIDRVNSNSFHVHRRSA